MRRRYLSIIIILLLIFNLILIYIPDNETKGTNLGGEFSGFLTESGSPYYITNNLTVPLHGFLDIRPGVVLKFNKDAVLYVSGQFFANGTKTKPIILTSNLASPYIGCWKGIKLYLNGYTTFEYCKISWASWGINADVSHHITIKNCEIFKCGNATEFSTVSNATIENCLIHDNTFNGVNSTYYSFAIEILNSTFYNNAKGIRFYLTFVSFIHNNSIYRNYKGVELRYSRLIKVTNNTINKTGPPKPNPGRFKFEDIALHMNRTYSNLIKNNNLLDTSGFSLLLNRSSYNKFENNMINNNTQSGIHMSAYCGYNVFQNNTIKQVPKSKIVLDQNCIENYFKNNTMSKGNNVYAVEYGEDSYRNSFAPDNTVNSVILPIYYQAPSDVLNSTLNSLSIAETKLTNIGQVVIVDCENFTVNRLRVYNGISGMFFYECHNVSIQRSRMIDNDYGFYFGFNNTNIIIDNSTITNAKYRDIYLYKQANVTIINSSFDEGRITNIAPSNLTIQWYLNVKVIHGYGAQKKDIKGANIKVMDAFNNLVVNRSTGSDGSVRYIRCTEVVKSDTGDTPHNNHNITALKMNYQPGYAGTGVKVDMTKWVTIRLKSNLDPILSGSISPSVTHNPKPQLTWFVGSDPENDPLVYWIQIANVKNPNKIIEQNKTKVPKYKISKNLTYGERYEISVNASDPYGGWSNKIISTIDLINNPPSKPIILLSPLQSKREPNRNSDLNCTIIEQSIDVDTNPKDKIRYNFLWYKDGIFQKELSIWNTTKSYHVLPSEYTNTGEVWSCEVFATDGIGISTPATDARTIRNTPPRIRKYPVPIFIKEDTVDYETLDLKDIFIDDDGDELEYSFTITGENITLEIQKDQLVLIMPETNWNGFELVRFTASDGETSIQTVVKITILPVNDPPFAQIISPINNTPILYNPDYGVRLKGIFHDPDLIYGDALNLTWQSSEIGVLGHSAILNNIILPNGTHNIEFIVQDQNGIMAKDSIQILIYNESTKPPDITFINLTSPFNGQVLKDTTITLTWEPVNVTVLEAESMLYDIYLYKADEPQELIIEKYVGTSITLPLLEDNQTYYWTIVPFRNNTQGVCLSGIWSFKVNLDIIFIFDFEISMNTSEIKLQTGKLKQYSLTIINTGNVPDNYEIEISVLNQSILDQYINLERRLIVLDEGQSIEIMIKFDIPKNFTKINLTDIFTLLVTSKVGGNSSEQVMNMSIIGFKKEIGIDYTDKEIPEDAPELMGIFMILLYFSIIILIIIIIFTIVLRVSINHQSRLLYPVKSKKIINKERTIVDTGSKENDKDKYKLEFEPEHDQDKETVLEVEPL